MLSANKIKRKRTAISIETKYEICQKREKGIASKDLIKEYGLSSSTISTIFSDKDKIVNEYESNLISSNQKRIKLSKYPQLKIYFGFLSFS